MNVSVFITLLAGFSTATSLVTEVVKKILDEKEIKYACNLLVLIVAAVVGTGGTAVYYVLNAVPFTTINVIGMFLMGIASAIGAMLGWDKCRQLVLQLSAINGK